ncbi:hypothetical protein Tco_1407125 [Tanacetum coccineum]
MNVLLLHLIERRDEKKRLDHLKQDLRILVIKRFRERKKVFRERKLSEKFLQRVCGGDEDEKGLVEMGEVGEGPFGEGEGGEKGRNVITVLAHGMAVAAPATETIAPTGNEAVELAATAELAKLATTSKDEWQ